MQTLYSGEVEVELAQVHGLNRVLGRTGLASSAVLSGSSLVSVSVSLSTSDSARSGSAGPTRRSPPSGFTRSRSRASSFRFPQRSGWPARRLLVGTSRSTRALLTAASCSRRAAAAIFAATLPTIAARQALRRAVARALDTASFHMARRRMDRVSPGMARTRSTRAARRKAATRAAIVAATPRVMEAATSVTFCSSSPATVSTPGATHTALLTPPLARIRLMR